MPEIAELKRLEEILRGLTDEEFLDQLRRTGKADEAVREVFRKEATRRDAANDAVSSREAVRLNASGQRSRVEAMESQGESVQPRRTTPASATPSDALAVRDQWRGGMSPRAPKHNPWFVPLLLMLSLAAAAAFSLGLWFAGAGQSSVASELIVAAGGLNVRSQPTARSDIVGRLKQGDTVSVAKHDSLASWAQLQSPNTGGWIDLAYASPTSANGDWPSAPWWIPPWWVYVVVSCLTIVVWKSFRGVERTRCGRCRRLYAWQRIASKELDRWVGSDVLQFSHKARSFNPRRPDVEFDMTSYVARPVTRVQRQHTLQCKHCGKLREVVVVDTLA